MLNWNQQNLKQIPGLNQKNITSNQDNYLTIQEIKLQPEMLTVPLSKDWEKRTLAKELQLQMQTLKIQHFLLHLKINSLITSLNALLQNKIWPALPLVYNAEEKFHFLLHLVAFCPELMTKSEWVESAEPTWFSAEVTSEYQLERMVLLKWLQKIQLCLGHCQTPSYFTLLMQLVLKEQSNQLLIPKELDILEQADLPILFYIKTMKFLRLDNQRQFDNHKAINYQSYLEELFCMRH